MLNYLDNVFVVNRKINLNIFSLIGCVQFKH